jgi:hypothetical protein
MAAPLAPRKTLWEQEVIEKLDAIIAVLGTGGSKQLLELIEDHLRYLRVSDMRQHGQVGDPANLPPAYIDQP